MNVLCMVCGHVWSYFPEYVYRVRETIAVCARCGLEMGIHEEESA